MRARWGSGRGGAASPQDVLLGSELGGVGLRNQK